MSFWAKLAPFSSTRAGLVPASGGGTSNFLRADGAFASPGASSNPLALNQHVIASNLTITAGYGVIIPRYVEIAAGITLEIGDDGDLEVT